MKRSNRWISLMTSLVVLSCILLSSELAYGQGPVVRGQVSFRTSPPAAGTVTFIAYLKKLGDTDNEILTEDNFNCVGGPDRGYDGSNYYVDTENFTAPVVAMGDTLVILFTGIGAELDSAGSVSGTVNTSVGLQDFPTSTWGDSSYPSAPTGLQAANASPGVVNLSWDSPKQDLISYRLYRSSQSSGYDNTSNGRYTRIAQDIDSTGYQDSAAPMSMCWYIVVAEDTSGNLSGHCDEVSIDAALPVSLTSFTATGAQHKVILEWTTETEWNNRGFHIYRREDSSQAFERITQELILGAGNSVEPQIYSWEDRRVEVGQTYWYRLESVDFQGGTQTFGPVSASPVDALPKTSRLSQNYPNPFNPQTWIGYQLSKAGPVSIRIYNIRGQLVKTLVDRQQTPGYYRVRWNGQDLHGAPAASGVYFCQMRSDLFVETIKMILLR